MIHLRSQSASKDNPPEHEKNLSPFINFAYWFVFVLLLSGLVLGAMWTITKHLNFVPDDSFITFTYARNLASGHGLRFNSTDVNPTEGYSSLLHVILLAATFRKGADPLVASRVIGLIAFLGASWVLGFSLSRLFRIPIHAGLVSSSAALMSLLFFPASRLHLASAMETMLFFFTVTLTQAFTILNLQQNTIPKYQWRLGIAAALIFPAVIIVRPEGLLLIALSMLMICAARLWTCRSLKAVIKDRLLVIVTLVLLFELTAFLIWKLLYFGHLLPNPYYVKMHNMIFGSSGHLLPGLWHVRQSLYMYLPWLFIATAALSVALIKYWRIAWPAALTAAPAAVIVALYSRAIHETAFGHRYEYPYLSSIVMLFLAVGFCFLYLRRRWLPLLAGLAMLFLYLTYVSQGIGFETFRWLHYDVEHISDSHISLGKDLRCTGLEQDATILLSGAGAVPYFSKFRSVDWIGLNDNYLSGRTRRSIDEVWEYISAKNIDVVYSILPPATAGYSKRHDDPAFRSPVVFRALRSWGTELFRFWNNDRVADMFYREMLYIRDNCEFGACYSLNNPEGIVLIAYVRKDSKHREAILKCLRQSRTADWASYLMDAYINDPRSL
jgi:hypothetical protein